eukprot:m.28831 g.28831  ORF g.28831 m.28831 type:complete len:331 (+) comp31062_c0_seq1:94-1086(+)
MTRLAELIATAIFCISYSWACPPGQYNITLVKLSANGTIDDECQTCSILCTMAGCIGPDVTDCFDCRYFGAFVNSDEGDDKRQRCVSSCPAHYVGNECREECPAGTYSAVAGGRKTECLNCHMECDGNCTTPGTAWNCTRCKNWQMPDGECVPICPDGYTANGNETCIENDRNGLTGEEIAALVVGVCLFFVVITLWVLLYCYVKRSRGGHDMKNTKGAAQASPSQPRLAVIELTQSAFAVNPTQYVDDWLVEQRGVTTVDWLSDQRVTLDNPLFNNSRPQANGSPSPQRQTLYSSDAAGYYSDEEAEKAHQNKVLNDEESSPSNFTNSL